MAEGAGGFLDAGDGGAEVTSGLFACGFGSGEAGIGEAVLVAGTLAGIADFLQDCLDFFTCGLRGFIG